MSLIQEALKRQQQESGQSLPAEAKPPVQQAGNTPIHLTKNTLQTAQEEAPLPLPSDSEQIPAEQTSTGTNEEAEVLKKKKLIFFGVMLIFLLAAGGAWAYFHFMKFKPLPQAVTAETVKPKQSPEKQPAAATPAPVVVTNEVQKPQTVVAPATPPPVQTPPPQAVAVPQPQTAKPAQPAPLPAPVRVEKAAAPPTKPAEEVVTWPTLSLSGVVGKGENGSAIINKQIVGVGESIEGVKVIAIRDKSIELEFKGKTQILRIGGSTQ